ncbi:TetR/AcrR family transcriptional regulator [Duganella sp. PWIR1]
MATERTYHHGDLRASLLASALTVVEAEGYEAVSLRGLAEQLGVSRGAPYRHYPERDKLLAELAEVGFNRLNEFAQQTSAKARDPVASLVGAAQQFLQFVDEHPQLFRLMYESGLLQRIDDFPSLAQAQSSVYERIAAMYAAAAGAKNKNVQARVIAFWSTIFGYAKIRQSSLLQPYMTRDLSAKEIEKEVIRAAIGPDLAGGGSV